MNIETNTAKQDVKVTLRNEWDKTGAVTWTQRLREIIDTALDKSTTFEEFLANMKAENVVVRIGSSIKNGAYFSFHLETSETFLQRRSTNLGEGYSYDDIMTRIATNAKVKEQNVQEREEPKMQRERISVNRDYRPRGPKL